MDRETQAILLFPVLFFVAFASLFIHGLVTGTVWTGIHSEEDWPRDWRANKKEYPLAYWFWMCVWALGASFLGIVCVGVLTS
jgi:hypothetical protein